MASTPSVSVIIPALNCAPFISAAIESVLKQGGDQLEVLVIDDGSTDETANIVRSYPSPVHLLRTQTPRSGAAAARNVGLRHAHGRLIAFLDGDDVWLPGKLALQTSTLENHPDVALVCTRGGRWEPDNESYEQAHQRFITADATSEPTDFYPAGWIYHMLLLRPAWVWTSTVVMRRELVEKVGEFDESLRLGQDYEYWLRCSRETQILRVAKVLALYRQHANNSTNKPRNRNFELEVVQRALDRWGRHGPDGQAADKKQIKKRFARMHFRMGYQHFWAGDPRIAAKEFYHSIRTNPRAWRAWAYASASAVRGLFVPTPRNQKPPSGGERRHGE
ncbi:glycosyltransferase [Halorhodospira halophila]|uniref:Glycosyl transferase, family 2 n=1 Tax=Halorhodospira halophila (strain DSM 244 / SL1) TaxID=349124 RepID=A1WXB8_HALHL|nr:glycosyltransferase [Halorhodospira halophila]ABM62330.1 glycosyl transferase, family 2 [Halorhodospira halophila SL1]MBK1730069.1 glycosyl transferase [Halorhodospira halophila]